MQSTHESTTRPLNGALQKVWVFRFFDPGPGGSGGPREASLSAGLPGAPGGLPEAPRDLGQTKAKNLET